MKLRIRGDSLRLRLSQAEVRALAAGAAVEETVGFAPGVGLTYRLTPSPPGPVAATFHANCIEVRLAADQARAWADAHDVGIEVDQPIEGTRVLRILIEKDFACLKPRAGEDETDAFPHPNAGSDSCD